MVFLLLNTRDILALVLERLGLIQKLENQLSKVVLLLDRLHIEMVHALMIGRLMVREEVQDLVQSVWSHRSILLTILRRNKLLQKLVAPKLVVCFELLEDGVERPVDQDELLEHVL